MTADWSDINDALVCDNRIWNVGRTGIHARSIVPAPRQTNKLQRCRFTNNTVGPCGGRGIWIDGDYNVIESNGIHACGSDPLLEGLFVENGRRNILRQNRLIDCLPLSDKGRETQAIENDLFWETKTPPASLPTS